MEAVKHGGVCISPDIWSDKYRKISYLGATAHFVEKDGKYNSVDLFCTEFTAKKKSGENIMKVCKTKCILYLNHFVYYYSYYVRNYYRLD